MAFIPGESSENHSSENDLKKLLHTSWNQISTWHQPVQKCCETRFLHLSTLSLGFLNYSLLGHALYSHVSLPTENAFYPCNLKNSAFRATKFAEGKSYVLSFDQSNPIILVFILQRQLPFFLSKSLVLFP